MSGGKGYGIGGWIKHSFIDFPGTVSTVLFFNGCNLRCPYCHNPELVRGSQTSVNFDEIIAYLRRRPGIIEGVVLSGGEPTLHGSALLDIVRELRTLGLTVKLDTNGLLPEMITAIAPDYCALDLKTSPSRYPELGCNIQPEQLPLLRSLDIIRAMGNRAEVRITVARPFIDNAVIEEFTVLLSGMENVFLQPLRTTKPLLDPDFDTRNSISAETIQQYRSQLATVVKSCIIRGD
ncbi:MAG: anaerobic ribonucleoside-triphosphate reductase activating protein [Chitinispirillaceae bacterium]|nr:anaerobic ribonucleoside-triphosphate reductase activating protein [Chitinispirillaceae bacterium]